MTSTSAPVDQAPGSVRRAIAKHSFCVLATSSGSNRPHAVGVLYAEVGGVLYVATHEGSKKVRNIRANPHVAACIPIRRFPMAPPFAVQFAATAEVVGRDDARVGELLRGRHLKKITTHGELDDPRTCFLRVIPGRRVSTYGIGVSLRTLLRNPLDASRTFDLEVSR